MPIPMEFPAKFLPAVIDGSVVRYGCILKHTGTGRIVGHLKELPGFSQMLSSVPVNPSLAGAQIGQLIEMNYPSQHVLPLLNHLKLISSVGAVASVAGLGVSVAGFTIVMKRLNRLEQKLNEAMERIRAEVEKLHLKFDMLEMARLLAACQQLDDAAQTSRAERRAELRKEADRTFQTYRHYYYGLIKQLQPMNRPQLSLSQVRELYSRFFLCALGELEANLLLNDFGLWHRRHEDVCKQVSDIKLGSPREMFASRVHVQGLLTDAEHLQIKEEVKMTHDANEETERRIETAKEEVTWLECHKTDPEEYLHTLQHASDEAIVLIPHDT